MHDGHRFPGNDRSYAVLLSKQRHGHAMLIGDGGGREP
jgi:hypothetical protein